MRSWVPGVRNPVGVFFEFCLVYFCCHAPDSFFAADRLAPPVQEKIKLKKVALSNSITPSYNSHF